VKDPLKDRKTRARSVKTGLFLEILVYNTASYPGPLVSSYLPFQSLNTYLHFFAAGSTENNCWCKTRWKLKCTQNHRRAEYETDALNTLYYKPFLYRVKGTRLCLESDFVRNVYFISVADLQESSSKLHSFPLAFEIIAKYSPKHKWIKWIKAV